MKNFAINDNGIIVNVIVCDSKELAEEITGFPAIETEGNPWMWWTYFEDKWRPPQPYPSWTWDGESWNSPIPMPQESGIWTWDEKDQQWVDESITE